MTKETAQKAAELLCELQNAERVLNFIDSQEQAWFGPRNCVGIGLMSPEAVAGARRAYQKLREHAESELETL